MEHILILQNLNCANCAAKIEKKIANTNGFENVSFNFATKQLKLKSGNNNIINEIQKICDDIEDGVTVVDFNAKDKNDDENENSSMLFLIISVALGAAAIVLSFTGLHDIMWGNIAIFALSLFATVLSGAKIFLKGIKSVFKLHIDETTLLFVAVVAAFCLGEFVEAAMVTILFAVGEIIEDKAVDASRHDIEKLAKIRPDTATIIVDGIEQTVGAENVKTGSTIVVKPFERVPLDGVITKGSTTLDTSALTGESMPVDATEGSSVMSGAINGSNLIEIKTTKEFGDSTATRILKLVEDAAAQKGQKEKLITRFASIYTPIVIVIAILIAAIPPLIGLGDFSMWLYRALVCLVASCPCAIVISVPLSYYSGIGSASKAGVLIKGGKYVEALAKADSFVFDKTGTLTSGKLSVNKVTSLSDFSEEQVLALAAACEKYSSHPIAVAIKNKADGLNIPQLSDYSENAGHGTSAVFDGKKIECGGIKILNSLQRKSVKNSDTVFIVYDNKIIGSLNVSDTVRPEAKKVISLLKNYGVKNAVMLTGDADASAQAVSNELEMTDYKSELLPADKLKNVQRLKRTSKAVCFVGDGINDAPVLSASDCGIAMGFGSEAAIEASDAVLASGNLKQLPTAIKIARKVMSTVKSNIVFALAVKAAVIVLAMFGLAAMWMSVLADTGLSIVCVLYSARLLNYKPKKD